MAAKKQGGGRFVLEKPDTPDSGLKIYLPGWNTSRGMLI
jgi:hypothetical protein